MLDGDLERGGVSRDARVRMRRCKTDTLLDYESRDCNCASQMGERKAESASARGLHRLKGLPLASAAGGRAWGVALGVSSVLEGHLEDWVRRAAFTVTLYRSGLRSVTYVSKFCKPLDLKPI